MPDIVLLILTVPTITAVIGWFTNLAAVKMIFHPEKFFGIRPVGWQGIIYKQSHKFATGIAEMATDNLLSPKEVAERLDPDELEAIFAATLDTETKEVCREAAEVIRPGAWDVLPDHVKTMVIEQAKAKTRTITRDVFDKLRAKSEELLDLHRLVYMALSGDNVRRLARLTHKIGHKEFKFIEYYGGVFGFIIGTAQIGVWSLMQTWWLMPIFGCIVGLVTNWLAIQMIFRPQEPKKYFGLFTYQGLFAKRQKEIAHDYGEVSAAEILTPANFIRIVTEGDSGKQIAALITEIVTERLEAEWKMVQPMVPVEVTPEMLEQIRQIVINRVTAQAPSIQPDVEKYLAKKLDVQNTVETRLANMEKPKFERLLRGIFEEDELTLIVVGGFLGAAVGVAQGALVLAL